MIKYLGSKRLLVPTILRLARSLPDVRTAVDLFSGTSRVGHALKREGVRVLAADNAAYAHALATCYVQADAEGVLADAARLIADLRRLPPSPGYFTETFCERSRFVHPRNGARIDAVRDAISRTDLDPELEAVLLVALMEAADRVDSTTGVQMAYLKKWAPRALTDLDLRVPDVLPRAAAGKSLAVRADARDAARRLSGDLAYLDPPYNQHAYLGNYHVWETLVRWDAPPVYGVACKREDTRANRSDFNSRRRCLDALRETVDAVDARCLIVSFSDEGYVPRAQMEEILGERGAVHVLERPYRRYVGARIGIHNPRGEKVGRVSHVRNTEYLYVVTPRSLNWSPPPDLAPPSPASTASAARERAEAATVA